jgi:6-phosphofructokinase 1
MINPTIHGNAVVGQSGGPTAAINATLAGVIRGMLKQKGSTLYGMRNGIDGVLSDRLIDLSATFTDEAGNIREDDLDLLAHTPAAALGSCRHKLPKTDDPKGEETYAKIIEIFKKYDIRTFFYIGGNDSMDTVAKLSVYTEKVGYPMTLIGVPKTIDNDLMGTDHTPGFGSAAKFVATVTREIIFDCAVYTIPAVTIVEIMGRDAGWLTAASAIGRAVDGIAPDYVYLPEVDFSMESFMSDVRAALAKHPNVVIAISEGIHLSDGTPVGASSAAGLDAFGHVQLGGAGKTLEYAVREQIGCKVRSIELNLPQRCAAHLASETDLCESVETGKAAVRAACEGVTRCMITAQRVCDAPYKIEFEPKDVSEIANKIRYVDDAFINAAGNHVTDACCNYLLPLIQGEAHGFYEGGLPKHLIFD